MKKLFEIQFLQMLQNNSKRLRSSNNFTMVEENFEIYPSKCSKIDCKNK